MNYETQPLSPQEESEARKRFVEEHNFVPLNELLSYHIQEKTEAYIHMGPAKTIPQETRMDLIIRGFHTLASSMEHEETLQQIESVGAISWIVTKYPGLLQSLGFTIDGPIPKDLQEKYFPDARIEVYRAHIDRKDFLKRYARPFSSNI